MIYIIIFFVVFIVYFSQTIFIKYKNESNPIFIKLKNDLRKIYPDIESINFFESYGKGNYTNNKKDIYLELRNCENINNPIEYNTLMYITLHELAHCLTEDIGHTENFYLTHEKLINQATLQGIYNSSFPINRNYCKV